MGFVCRCAELVPQQLKFRLCQEFVVALLEHLGVYSFVGFSSTVFDDFVNEKKGQNLDAFIGVSQFFLKMHLNRPPDLRSLDDILIKISDCLA